MTEQFKSKDDISRTAEVVVGNGGLHKLRVRATEAEGEIYVYGAHLCSWKPTGHQDVIWLGNESRWEEGKAIRGGIPICFPWFGPKKNSNDAPLHGFARVRQWQLESVEPQNGSVTATLSTKSDSSTKLWWPADFELRYRVTFGSKLVVNLELTNTGDTPLSAEEALHTYFAVGDVRQAEIRGLEGERYLDRIDGGKEKIQQDVIRISEETDRAYLNTSRSIEIVDPVLRRRIRVSKQNSQETVVWNPWINKSKAMPDFGDDEWLTMVCVETCNLGADIIQLAPGQQHTMSATIEAVSL